jgi:hypothetical protein
MCVFLTCALCIPACPADLIDLMLSADVEASPLVSLLGAQIKEDIDVVSKRGQTVGSRFSLQVSCHAVTAPRKGECDGHSCICMALHMPPLPWYEHVYLRHLHTSCANASLFHAHPLVLPLPLPAYLPA